MSDPSAAMPSIRKLRPQPLRVTLTGMALGLVAAAAVSSPASAAWVTGESLDGPSADIASVGGVDVARDGTGALVYLKRVGGVRHVFVSRLVGGAWSAPEQVDVGLPGDASAASVAVGDELRVAVVFVSDGRAYGTVAPEGSAPRGFVTPSLLADAGSTADPVTDPAVDMGINGTAYAAFRAPGAGGSDVLAARVEETAWERVAGALDVDPAAAAGAGDARPRIAVSAEGNAVAVWGEGAPGGPNRVIGRRITGLSPSAFPQQVSVDAFAGAPGGSADSADISIEDDGSYAWAVWRQDFGGVSRTLGRRLVGSQYEAPGAVDGGQPAETPRVAINGNGLGAAVSGGRGTGLVLQGPFDQLSALGAADRVNAAAAPGTPTLPVVAAAARRQVGFAWVRGTADGLGEVRGRLREEGTFGDEAVISNPAFGPVVGGPAIGTSKVGDMPVAFVQGTGAAARIVVAAFDRAPANPLGTTTENWQRRSAATLSWKLGTELWGGQSVRVILDGKLIGTSTGQKVSLDPTLPDGQHTWHVEAVDRRGQVTASRERVLRLDRTAPAARLKVTGSRRRGKSVSFAVTSTDTGGSGVRGVRVTPGDGSKALSGSGARHVYRRAGRYTVVVRVTDRAGNVRRLTGRLRIAG